MILAHAKQSSYSSLERLIQQTTVVRQHLNQEVNKVILMNAMRFKAQSFDIIFSFSFFFVWLLMITVGLAIVF